VNCCRAVLPHMQDNRRGAIINIASLCGLGAIPEIPVSYTASKFAVIGFTKAIALEYAPFGIRVNAVCPGAINTDMRTQLFDRIAEEQGISPSEAQAAEDATIAMGRGGEAAEVARAVAFLASENATYITGTAIPVAGGMAPGL
jgi:NAD(P)-dependent dehydrogenase (short-subunit alcohol dehydrogenase family)